MATTTTSAAISFGTINVSEAIQGVDMTRRDNAIASIFDVNIAFIIIVSLVVSLRLFTRFRILHHWGSDDLLIVIAALFAIALSATSMAATGYGLGKHVWMLDITEIVSQITLLIKTLFFTSIIYHSAGAITKISIIVTYLRIFPYQTFRKLMWGTLALVIAMLICSIFVTTFQCRPVHAAWDFLEAQEHHWHCIDYFAFLYTTAAMNVVQDLILCTFPLPLFWKLKISRKEKAIVCIIFGFGFFATIASVMRLAQLHSLSQIDVTFNAVNSLNWSVVEVGTGIFCASVPSLKPLVTWLWPGRLFSTAGHSTRHTTTRDHRTGGHGASSNLNASSFIHSLKVGSTAQDQYEMSFSDPSGEKDADDTAGILGGGKSEYTARVYAEHSNSRSNSRNGNRIPEEDESDSVFRGTGGRENPAAHRDPDNRADITDQHQPWVVQVDHDVRIESESNLEREGADIL